MPRRFPAALAPLVLLAACYTDPIWKDPNGPSRDELSVTDQRDLVAFLHALTDPSARDMSSIVPASVPSGLSIRY